MSPVFEHIARSDYHSGRRVLIYFDRLSPLSVFVKVEGETAEEELETYGIHSLPSFMVISKIVSNSQFLTFFRYAKGLQAHLGNMKKFQQVISFIAFPPKLWLT